jgi:hypothetical protein
MTLTKKEIKAIKKQVEVALRTPAYDRDFNLYWKITASLRTDPEDPKWDEIKALKKEEWEKAQ